MRTLILISILSLVAQFSFSQNSMNDPHLGEFWLSLQGGLPSQALKDHLNHIAIGGGLGGVYNPSKKSNYFQIGADLSWCYLDKYKTTVNDLKIKTTNTVLTYHFIMRIRPESGSFIKPYGDLMIGGKTFFSALSDNKDIFESIFNGDDDGIYADQSHTAFSYGPGLGITFDNSSSVKFDVKVNYLFGGKVQYIRPENATLDTQTFNVEFVSEEVKNTSIIIAQVGVIFKIGKFTPQDFPDANEY